MTRIKLLAITLLGSVLFNTAARADEGMWIPMLIGKNYDQMKKQGFKLTAEDLYSINKVSLKDAIVSLGGGFCTGEVVSNRGLVFTNHHCGYDAIASNSTPQNNILDNGFYAKGYAEEKPIPGLFVQFLVRIDDVSPKVMNALKGVAEADRNAKIAEVSKQIVADGTKGTTYDGVVKDFYNGNQYFLYTYQKYSDVRLVGAPQQSIGKFGGDTDNWEWPRHTGDFSIFRIYAGKDGKPAAYSPENVPLTPKRYLPISIKGVKNGDFAMVYGYPGRTDRFLTSNGVKLAVEETNPVIVKLRDIRLRAWKEEMDKSVDTRLKLSSKYANIANYWKYFIGQTDQLKRLKVADRKLSEEDAFTSWAAGKPEYAGIMDRYKQLYAAYEPYAVHRTYITEGLLAPNFVPLALNLSNALSTREKAGTPADVVANANAAINKGVEDYTNTTNYNADKKIFAGVMSSFYKDVPQAQHPKFIDDVVANYKAATVAESFAQYFDYLWQNSAIVDPAKLKAFMQNPSLQTLSADPAVVYAQQLNPRTYLSQYLGTHVTDFLTQKAALDRLYLQGLLQENTGKMMYPDANSTMRITYGNVKDYSPKDGVQYKIQTTLDGVMEKYKPGDDEFDLPASLITAYRHKDFGQYAANGTIPVGFITTDDITGGNSGSPVINGSGELIGLAFDGNWEAMSGDISFDRKYKRTICVDVRYVLWCIDVLGGAKNLISELAIKK